MDLESELVSVATGGQGYVELASKILELREERENIAKKLVADANM